MEDKYYTPKIEEFYIGFEYEYLHKDNWISHEVYCYTDIQDAHYDIELNKIRVKYLDSSDIESFGFKHKQNNQFESNEDNYLSLEYFDENKGWYLVYSENESQFGFGGWIKNKSELGVLLKQLNVINE